MIVVECEVVVVVGVEGVVGFLCVVMYCDFVVVDCGVDGDCVGVGLVG